MSTECKKVMEVLSEEIVNRIAYLYPGWGISSKRHHHNLHRKAAGVHQIIRFEIELSPSGEPLRLTAKHIVTDIDLSLAATVGEMERIVYRERSNLRI